MSKCFVVNPVTNIKSFRDYTDEEQAEYDARMKILNDSIVPRKLEAVRKLRNKKLQETDWMAMSDLTMSDAWKTKRQSWRDLPQNNSTEAEYDAILERDANGVLTNAIWSDA